MVYINICQITIKNLIFKKVVDVQITSTINDFTDTSILTFPKLLKSGNQDIFSDVKSFMFGTGDTVTIQLGFINNLQVVLNTVFTGFIKNINVGESLVNIECENYSYWLKKCTLNFSSDNITLQALAQKIVNAGNALLPSGVTPMTVSTNGIGLSLPFKAEHATGLECLDVLKSKYTLQSYFVNNQLTIGVNYSNIGTTQLTNTHTISMYPRPLIKLYSNDTFLFPIQTNLEWQESETVLFNITAKVFTYDNQYIEYKFGDPDGEVREFLFYTNNYSKSNIQNLVNQQINRIKYTGYKRGSTVQTFGVGNDFLPIQKLDVCVFDGIGLINWGQNQNPLNQKSFVYSKSSYLIDSVQTSFNTDGYFQTISIQQQLNNNMSNSIASLIQQGNVIDINNNTF